MKISKSTWAITATLFVGSAFAVAGNERGGGTSPAPVFMPQDTTYVCEVKHTQLNTELHTPLVSRATQKVSWKKGDYAGAKGTDLKDITVWKHYRLKQIGPFRPSEVEVPVVPSGALFEGYFSIRADSPGDPAALGMTLRVQVKRIDAARVSVSSEGSRREILQSGNPLQTSVQQQHTNVAGDISDQRSLEVDCKLAK